MQLKLDPITGISFLPSSTATGDVVGPAASSNGTVVLFDGTTGKLVKDSTLTISGSNTGDQTTIVGITGTKAQFNTAVTDGDVLYVGDVTQYTDELAQDAVGGMVDSTLVYTDATPLLSRASLTGDVTCPSGSNTTTISAGVVTFAKIQNITTSRLLGRTTALSGSMEEITLGTNLSFSGSTLNAVSGSGGSSTWTETEIDFGTLPIWDKRFSITDAAVSGSSKIMPIPSGNVGTSRKGNDQEWDNLILAASAGTGAFTLIAIAIPGPVVGKRKVFYQVA